MLWIFRASGAPAEHELGRRMSLTSVYQRYKFYTMEFEFDPRKSRSNKKKHGIDFVEAQALWDDMDIIVIPARTADEPRFLVVGKIGEDHWSGVITHRGVRIRIISVRRSRDEEIELYEG
jgi:uncharacterized DUF497 family protein